MNARGRKRPPALTPEESRLLDDALPPEDAKRLDRLIAADPERADAMKTYREAMGVWRDDARRTGPTADTMADQVLARLGQGEVGGGTSIPTWYAVAAMLLISVGVLGTATLKQRQPRRVLPASRSIDATILEALVDDELMMHTPAPLARPGPEGR